MPTRPANARVLFDEAHGEAWSIRPEVAAEMQPSHPGDSSYAAAAQALRRRDLDVAAHTAGPLDAAALADADVLVIAHPSEPAWERTVPGGGSPKLTDAELDAVEAFVRAGGGLVLLGEEEQAKYASNLADLSARFGVAIASDTASDYERHRRAPHWILADLERGQDGVDLLARVHQACFYRATTLSVTPEATAARVVARTSPSASVPDAPLMIAVEAGAGRVVVVADSDLFGDDCIGELDHEQLWANLIEWSAAGAFRRAAPAQDAPALDSPHWAALKAEVDALRLQQRSDGSVDLDEHDADRLGERVEAVVAAIEGLAQLFAHQADYLQAVVADLRTWARDGFGTPDFTAALEAFRPEPTAHATASQHLVVFPMYKQNGSRDTVFEALVVGVPWPGWLSELERTRYDNAQVRPGHARSTTPPATTPSARSCSPRRSASPSRPANHFGGIFCDREAARFRRASAPRGRAPAPEPAARRRRPARLRAAVARRLRCCGTSSTTGPTATATCPSTRS